MACCNWMKQSSCNHASLRVPVCIRGARDQLFHLFIFYHRHSKRFVAFSYEGILQRELVGGLRRLIMVVFFAGLERTKKEGCVHRCC